MNFQEALTELERNHYYPKAITEAGSSEISYLRLPTTPHYKDDRLLLMKGLLPKEFKLKWNKKEEAIIIEKA